MYRITQLKYNFMENLTTYQGFRVNTALGLHDSIKTIYMHSLNIFPGTGGIEI